VILDDDFGNRIQPVKVNRSIRMRIAMGDIDEELDNIGNRLPPPKHPRKPEDEDEINYNVAAPAQDLQHEFDERQPTSNATQMFPSSARFLGDGSRARGANGNGNGNGNGGGRRKRRRGGAANGGAQTHGKGQPRQGQPHHPQQRHARHQQGKKGNRQGGNRGQARQERRSGNP
jgi:hypothetical protein